MKHSSRPRRTASNLSESTRRQLNTYALAASAAQVSDVSESTLRQLSMYALAASAAGVSLLALTQPSEAKIVYTRANMGLGSVVRLDLNHDGTYDFYLVAQINTGKSSDWGVFPAQAGNLVVGTKGQASALRAGVRVGPKAKFPPYATVLARVWKKSDTGTTYSSGQWRNVKNRYLGLKFLIQGKIHFGWARMNIALTNHSLSGVLTGYAYETIPNKPIITGDIIGEREQSKEMSMELQNPVSLAAPTPEPATLGLLAMGWSGVSIWRREESAGASS
jgi:hypothetical protein